MARRGYREITFELTAAEFERLRNWGESETRTPSQQTTFMMRRALMSMELVERGLIDTASYPSDGEETDANGYVAQGAEDAVPGTRGV